MPTISSTISFVVVKQEKFSPRFAGFNVHSQYQPQLVGDLEPLEAVRDPTLPCYQAFQVTAFGVHSCDSFSIVYQSTEK